VTATLWPAAIVSALWIAWIAITVIRFLDTRSLDAYSAVPQPDAPLVSLVIPARNEAHNMERCLRSVLASGYPRLEVLVVDDHSADGTGAIARRIAAEDPQQRVRVLDAPPLPDGWFGKQWACHSGVQAARGKIFCFTDADTTHGPELLTRSVNAMQLRGADLFTVAGKQEMVGFWEKVVQPFVFAILLARYGGLEEMSRRRTVHLKIANGQFLLFRREAYDAVGGHAAVRAHVAEDMRLAQRITAAGLAMHMVLARAHLSTRMYTSLQEIRRGWGKNVFAAARDSMPVGDAVWAVIRVVYPVPALVVLVPTVALILGLSGLAGANVLWFGVIVGSANLLFWVGVYRFSELPAYWALTHPLAALVFGWILAEAAWRGSRVEWKGRAYVSRSE
jgi:chlorobactene glucosyltransferase